MNEEELIAKILRGGALADSKDLLNWVGQTEDNKKDYIQYKNLWALLQTGDEMNQGQIEEGFKGVKSKINEPIKRRLFKEILKYAAIIIVAIAAGFFVNTRNFESKTSMNEIVVPKGNRSCVVLPDGTKVWLSNDSKLVYPEKFHGKTRDVKLEGEAFFNVIHSEKKPFLVNLGGGRIKVLGTEFSVTAYPEDETIQTDLIKGKIQLDVNMGKGSRNYKSFVVKPSYSLVYNKLSGEIFESKISDGFYNYWQNGIYEFKDEKFEYLAKKIERIYNVKVMFEDEQVKERKFTGTLKIDDNIYTMMEVFIRASGRPIVYHKERDNIYIKLKK